MAYFLRHVPAVCVGTVAVFLSMFSTAISADVPAKTLSDFLAAEWDYAMAQNPEWASSLGDHRFDDRWQDVSLDAIEARLTHARDALARLQTIDHAALTPADQINFDLYARNLRTSIEEHRFRFYLCPLSQQSGVQTADDVLTSLAFGKVKDYENWLARLDRLSVLIDQTTALMREGMRSKILLPKVVMSRVSAQISKQLVRTRGKARFSGRSNRFPALSAPRSARHWRIMRVVPLREA